MRKILLALIVVAVAVIAAAIYFYYDPSAPGNLFPRCIFLTFTGYKCPGCGSQRAIHALMNGHLLQAFKYNAALMVAVPLATFYLIVEWKSNAWPRLYNALNSSTAGIIILIAIIAWWILRNILNW